jgi:hypothetical protein
MLQQPPLNADVEERLRRLEADKDSLQLQVTVLTEQIEVQSDKISDLEKLLDEKKMQLANAEDMLQRVSGCICLRRETGCTHVKHYCGVHNRVAKMCPLAVPCLVTCNKSTSAD